VVPTWNYVTVHFTGPLTVHRDPEWLRDVVTRLTERHETGRPAPWSVAMRRRTTSTASSGGSWGGADYRHGGAKYKLSQNRSAEDQAAVTEGAGRRARPGPGRDRRPHDV
jgi:transcriptional regulator